ncbi:MAG: F0F1 ATP synthase subunit epsilon [Alphaproteobacteria bacterium]|nr:F0F1 ATP synthase subunit epsilon [Alphaproteobacteria bacterium]
MANTVQFELVSPERLLVSKPAEMIVVPGAEGDFGVLPGHAPMISTVRPGIIGIYRDGKIDERIFVAGGFAEVMPDRCTVLADEAISLAGIDRAAAEARVRAAKEAVDAAVREEDIRAAKQRLAGAELLLKAVEGTSGH